MTQSLIQRTDHMESKAMEFQDLPTLNAVLNTVSSVLLINGYRLIRQGKRIHHRNSMLAALLVSSLFLASYLIYHFEVGSRAYEGTGILRTVYFTILLSHTLLAASLVLLVPLTVFRALRKGFEKHRRLARYTFPIWLYVSVTGVVIYLMLYGL